METKITLEQLILAEGAVTKLATCKTLKAKTKYWLGKLVEEGDLEAKRYHQTRIDLLNRYGKPPIEGEKEFTFEPGQRDLFEQEMKELLETEVSFRTQRISFDELDKTDITALEMNSIRWLIESEEPQS